MRLNGVVTLAQTAQSLSEHSAVSHDVGRHIASPNERILITGAAGFIGCSVVESLLQLGYRNLVCFTRKSNTESRLQRMADSQPLIEIVKGNLLSPKDCEAACENVSVILHLAAGTSDKSYPNAYLNSVVTTRNLLEASLRRARLKRFALVSSFAVYTNSQPSSLLDESCPIEENASEGRDAYCFAKVRQERIVREYGENHSIPYVILRPGSVYGDGRPEITGRVGLGTFGVFLHLGGSNRVPFTYVENCADAIALAGLMKGIDGEVFNIVDDDVPSSRKFLCEYKKNVRKFRSIYIPKVASRLICSLWEKYSQWSQGQLPPVFSRQRWFSEWRSTRYSNQKLKARLDWSPRVPTAEAMQRYFTSCAKGGDHA